MGQGDTVVRAPLEVLGREWLMTCVSMGNPHAITFGARGGDLKVCLASFSPIFHIALHVYDLQV